MDDCISRQAAIDTVVAWTVEDRPDIEMPTDLIDRIKNMPSAQPEPQWIPCTSTKRPKDREEVMVTIDDGYRRYTDTDEFVNGQYWYHDDKQVVAWKPFDEPWRGESNDRT